MKKVLILFVVILTTLPVFSQNQKTIKVSDDISLVELSDKIYMHVTAFQTENWGKVYANGVLLIDEGEAFMFDTPWNDDQTKTLYNWLADSMKVAVTTVIPNHWHEDCMGGLEYLHSKGVKSYANQMTIDITRQKGLPVPQNGFKELLVLQLNGIEVICYYPGAGHATDNIVVWIPSEKVLFPGCLTKDSKATNLGNVADGDVHAWPKTITKVMDKFPDATLIIPGHGKPGGREILSHTLDLLRNQK